jgi:AraC-like DNA-binding protein
MISELPIVRRIKEDRGCLLGTATDREWSLTMAEKGVCSILLPGTRFSLGPGDCLLMAPHSPHTIRAEKESICHIVLNFTWPESGAAALRPSAGLLRLPAGPGRRVRRLLRGMLEEWRERGRGFETILSGRLLEVMALLGRHGLPGSGNGRAPGKAWRNVAEAIRFMRAHLHDPRLDIGRISREAHLSYAYFCRAFRRETGSSPNVFLTGLRLERAKDLLRDPRRTCTEVARESGFASVHAFSRTFKSRVGVSPGRWREG